MGNNGSQHRTMGDNPEPELDEFIGVIRACIGDDVRALVEPELVHVRASLDALHTKLDALLDALAGDEDDAGPAVPLVDLGGKPIT